jgi:glycosyltransferase involved in cell wall biosynthesis
LAEAGTATIVPYGDAGALANQIVRYLTDPVAARREAEAAHGWVQQNFDWEAVTDRWEAVYRQCFPSVSMDR